MFDCYKCEFGFFSLKCYFNEEGGIFIFVNVFVVIWKVDLVVGVVDVVFVGVLLVLGLGWWDDKYVLIFLCGMYGLSGYSVEGGIDLILVM